MNAQVDLTERKSALILILDVKTRWSSTHQMLRTCSILPQRGLLLGYQLTIIKLMFRPGYWLSRSGEWLCPLLYWSMAILAVWSRVAFNWACRNMAQDFPLSHHPNVCYQKAYALNYACRFPRPSRGCSKYYPKSTFVNIAVFEERTNRCPSQTQRLLPYFWW